MTDSARPQDVFSQRAAFYATSKTHSDISQLEGLVALAAPQADWWVLDVGAGTGHTALAFAPHVARTVGVDLTYEMLAQARLLQQARGQDVTWLLGDAEALPLGDASFDLVACRRAAHHYVDIERAIDEMVRVLKPGGLALIDDRSVPEDDAVDALMNQLDTWHDHSHVRQYRASEWTTMLQAKGLLVDHLEMYLQHRPLTIFAHGASAEDVVAIRERLAAATPHEREVLQLEERDGELSFNNWYLCLRAIKCQG
jgi:ubiquinone/menaquinone biosynthesis C-methylase UbiE